MQNTKSPYPSEDSSKNCFVMMRYRHGEKFREIEKIIRETFKRHGISAGFAKDKNQNPLLWSNVCTFMDHARFGIAVFDGIDCYKEGEPRANPNVCLELGYMLAKGADCLLLCDTANQSGQQVKLFTDLAGHIVVPFNSEQLGKSFQDKISTWIQQRVQIAPIFDGFAQMFPHSKIARRIKEQPQAKLAIARYIVDRWKNHYGVPKSLLLDSGTTAAAIAEEVMLNADAFTKSAVYTNNLLVSLMLSSKNQLKCHVLSGVVDDTFACVFSKPPERAIPRGKIDTAIISCTGFSPLLGPLANSEKNREFKLAAIRRCKECYLVFGSDKLRARDAGVPVFPSKREWGSVLETKIKRVITDVPSSSKSTSKTKIGRLLGTKLKEVGS